MSNYYGTRYSFDEGRVRVWRAICEYLQKYVSSKRDTVVDLGAGYCDFINNINAHSKIAIDLNPDAARFCNADVSFINAAAGNLEALESSSVDVLFASNLLEHLDDNEMAISMLEFQRVLKSGGVVILLQPNYRYAFKEYFDDYTHKKVYTHVSLTDYFIANGFTSIKIYPKFLPFSLKSRLPKSYLLTKLYLLSPIKPLAKQMLLIFKKL